MLCRAAPAVLGTSVTGGDIPEDPPGDPLTAARGRSMGMGSDLWLGPVLCAPNHGFAALPQTLGPPFVSGL